MRCRTCDYPLWNLTTRSCPECGKGFLPTDFEFVPNSVRFCCPHCDQAYYGTTAEGHLEPPAFDCVQCGRPVTMNEMVLRPAEGVGEERTKPATNHWLDRQRIGLWRGWWRSIVQALITPAQLIRGTPETSSLGQALWFAILTMLITIGISMLPAMCFVGLPMFFAPPGGGGGGGAGGPTPGVLAGLMVAGTVVGFLFGIAFLIIYLPVWALVTHGLLRMTGPCGPFRRTMQAICYSSGTLIISVIPCLGNAASIWWVVSAVLMVKDGHRIGGGRATFAVLTLPVILLAALVALYVGLIALSVTAASASTSTAGLGTPRQAEGQVVLDAILAHATDHQGAGPGHATQMLIAGGMTEYDFVSSNTPTDVTDIPIGRRSLFEVRMMDPADQAGLFDDQAAALPVDVVAHRVGDFVFTYHGIDLRNADPGLWVVIAHPDPDSPVARQLAGLGLNRPRDVHVGRADGMVVRIPIDDVAVKLAEQNRLRADAGLPPLPLPGTVTHEQPAAPSE